jgi:hypothetical protein
MSVISDILSGIYDTAAVPNRVIKVFNDSRSANNNMQAHNYIVGDTDDYWHRKAIAEQSAKGIIPGGVALGLGLLNEAKDILLGGGLENSKKDLQRNWSGYKIGRENKNNLGKVLENYQNTSIKDWKNKYADETDIKID